MNDQAKPRPSATPAAASVATSIELPPSTANAQPPRAAISQSEINDILWRACDSFRGTIDASDYKNYVLVMLFVKVISDVWKDHYQQYKAQFGDDETRIQRKLARERFVLPDNASFDYLHAQREAPNLGELINIPPINEQRRIAGFFGAVDRELSLLHSQLTALQTQKRGLMQQLLTGKVRVPLPDADAEAYPDEDAEPAPDAAPATAGNAEATV